MVWADGMPAPVPCSCQHGMSSDGWNCIMKLSRVLKSAISRIYPLKNALFHFQRLILYPRLRRMIARLLARGLPPKLHPHRDYSEIAEVMGKDGFRIFPHFLSHEKIADIREYLEGKELTSRFSVDQTPFKLDRAPKDCHVAEYTNEDIVRCPHVLEIANDPLLIAAAEELLGCRPTISSLSLWWSLPEHSQARDAELFHRDVDDWAFVKFFVYLTDVDLNSGPHAFVKGSHRVGKMLRIRRYQDDEVNEVWGADAVQRFCGPAGTAILENTFGLHKGQRPTDRSRLIFQVQYSLFPVAVNDYPKTRMVRSPRAVICDRWINRLYWETETDLRCPVEADVSTG
jgi:hypothetical protein